MSKKKIAFIVFVLLFIVLILISQYVVIGEIVSINSDTYIIDVKEPNIFVLSDSSSLVVHSKNTDKYVLGNLVLVLCQNGIEESEPPVVTAVLDLRIKK